MAPLYWYGLPTPAKLCLDHWSHWMRLDDGFKAAMAEKRIWLVRVHSGSTPEQIAPAADGLRYSAQYFCAHWGGLLLGLANSPVQIEEDADAQIRARTFVTA